MSKSKDKCEDCKFWQPAGRAGPKGFCWYKNSKMSGDSLKCKKFENMDFEDFAAGAEFSHGRAYTFAGIKKREEKELQNLIIRVIEVGLIAALVGVTIYFGIK